MASTCDQCGAAVRADAVFCGVCGKRIAYVARGPFDPISGILLTGAILDRRYSVQRRISAGGMGAVYLAQDVRLGQAYCAIKEMQDAFTSSSERQEAAQRFQAEALMLAQLHHPRIPRVTNHFLEYGRYYLVMDFIEGETLLDKLNKSGRPGLTEVTVTTWALQALEVLEYLHNRNPPILFRDIKPSNLMCSSDDDGLVFIDFGIARLFAPAQRGTMIGTPGYAAPEQYQGLTEPRSDLYSLGATMHHLLSGRDPQQNAPFSFAALRNVVPHISLQIEAIVIKALHFKIEDRFGSVAEMKQAILNHPPLSPSVSPTRPTSRDGKPMVLVPAGEFLMGSPNGEADAQPVHKVRLDAFYIDKYPVTNSGYKRYIDANPAVSVPYADEEDADIYNWDPVTRMYPKDAADYPVVLVSWHDAMAYAGWAGKRLPTEAEWEKAARGTDRRKWPWGSRFDSAKCNTVESKIGETTAVDEYSPMGDSPFGVSDMAGNVGEWVADWYDENYYMNCQPIEKNPTGPAKGVFRVIRGGAWLYSAQEACTFFRDSDGPDARDINMGFRCATDAS